MENYEIFEGKFRLTNATPSKITELKKKAIAVNARASIRNINGANPQAFVTWNAVTNAEEYSVNLGASGTTSSLLTDQTQQELLATDFKSGTRYANITVNALADGYLPSDESNIVRYDITTLIDWWFSTDDTSDNDVAFVGNVDLTDVQFNGVMQLNAYLWINNVFKNAGTVEVSRSNKYFWITFRGVPADSGQYKVIVHLSDRAFNYPPEQFLTIPKIINATVTNRLATPTINKEVR